jgi:hypothetical protein
MPSKDDTQYNSQNNDEKQENANNTQPNSSLFASLRPWAAKTALLWHATSAPPEATCSPCRHFFLLMPPPFSLNFVLFA